MGVVLLVRHGQASFGADDYDVLSDTGWTQGRLLGTWLAERGVVPTSLVYGGMRRQRDTAAAMIDAAGWADLSPTVDPGWDEFDHVGMVAAYPDLPADLDLTDRRAFQQVFEEATAHWTAGEPGDFTETYAAFDARVRQALFRAVSSAGSGQTVVVVSSGGPIAVACSALIDHDARLWQRFNTVIVNSSVTRVIVGPTGPRLLTFNEHPHLGGDLATYR